MSDEHLKRTKLLPRFGKPMPYNTLVMDTPPEMTAILEACELEDASSAQAPEDGRAGPTAPIRRLPDEEPADAPRTSLLQTLAPAGPSNAAQPAQTCVAALRTRMVMAEAVPTFEPAPVAPPPPPPPEVVTVSPANSSKPGRLRSILIYGGGALVLAVCGLTTLAPNAPAQAKAATTAGDESEHAPAPSPAPTASDAKPEEEPSAAPLGPTEMTEAVAGAHLLAGRHAEALEAYRQLANSNKRTPGIDAMVSVLSQKVESRD